VSRRGAGSGTGRPARRRFFREPWKQRCEFPVPFAPSPRPRPIELDERDDIVGVALDPRKPHRPAQLTHGLYPPVPAQNRSFLIQYERLKLTVARNARSKVVDLAGSIDLSIERMGLQRSQLYPLDSRLRH